MTNKEFVNVVMDPGEVNAFLRMWDTWLKNKEKPGEPIWIKEERYEEFMNMEFSQKAWDDACTPKALPGSVPKDFMRSIKWAFRLSGRDERAEEKKSKKQSYNSVTKMHDAAVAQAEKEVPNKNKVRRTF